LPCGDSDGRRVRHHGFGGKSEAAQGVSRRLHLVALRGSATSTSPGSEKSHFAPCLRDQLNLLSAHDPQTLFPLITSLVTFVTALLGAAKLLLERKQAKMLPVVSPIALPPAPPLSKKKKARKAKKTRR
jgi:hypothetical protein